MEIHYGASKVWILAPKIIISFDQFWCENSNFSCFKMNSHNKMIGFGANNKIGEKLRIFEQRVLCRAAKRTQNVETAVKDWLQWKQRNEVKMGLLKRSYKK